MSVVLSEHLPLLASAPDGIQKLRGLILELAVRGKLVPQNLNDEPASELLKRIALERASLEAKGGGKKSKLVPPVEESEQPFELPDGWTWGRIADVANSQAGFAFKSSAFNDAGIGLPLIRIRDVGFSCPTTFFDGPYREEFVVTEGDYLVSMDGQFRVAVWTGPDALLNQRVSRLQFFSSELAQAFFAISLHIRLAELQGIKAYTTVDHLSGGQISAAVVGIPPLVEQYRIVAKVDELMALCDRLEAEQADAASAHARLVETLLGTLIQSTDAADLAANWQRLSEHFDTLFSTEASIDALKHAILELAVTGRLLAQDKADRPVSDTLDEMELAGGNAKVRRGVAAVADSLVYTLPQSLPRTWSAESIARLLQLGAIEDVKDGNHGANHPKVSEFSATGLPFITAAQVRENGTIDYDCAYKVSGAPLEKLRVGFARSGDVIYTHKGSVGRVAICDRDCVLTPQTTYYRLNPTVIQNHFFAYFLKSPSFRNQVDVVKRQTTRDFVSISAQYEFFCHIPPIEEQIRIVERVDELMSFCDILKADLAAARERQATLADTLIESALEAV